MLGKTTRSTGRAVLRTMQAASRNGARDAAVKEPSDLALQPAASVPRVAGPRATHCRAS